MIRHARFIHAALGVGADHAECWQFLAGRLARVSLEWWLEGSMDTSDRDIIMDLALGVCVAATIVLTFVAVFVNI